LNTKVFVLQQDKRNRRWATGFCFSINGEKKCQIGVGIVGRKLEENLSIVGIVILNIGKQMNIVKIIQNRYYLLGTVSQNVV